MNYRLKRLLLSDNYKLFKSYWKAYKSIEAHPQGKEQKKQSPYPTLIRIQALFDINNLNRSST